jgi:hypothetical protein
VPGLVLIGRRRGTPLRPLWNPVVRMLTPLTDKEEIFGKSTLRIRGVKKLNNATDPIPVIQTVIATTKD